MSKAFESKFIEEQQNESASKPLSPKAQDLQQAEIKRQRQALELQRERILSERTSSAHRRAALAQALEEIEARLAKLD